MDSEKTNFAREQCVPCQGDVPPMAMNEAKKNLSSLDKEWSINVSGHLERIFLFKNFADALALAIKLGTIADREGHHPDLLVSYGKLHVEVWTHKIDGLSRSDFVLAAKFDEAVHEAK
jgi:4a-hydroxytetrahydrobiopterin dehydratase